MRPAPVRHGHSCSSLNLAKYLGEGTSRGATEQSVAPFAFEAKWSPHHQPAPNPGWAVSHLRDAKMTQLVSLPTKSVRKYPSGSNLFYVRGLLKVGESLKTNQAQE